MKILSDDVRYYSTIDFTNYPMYCNSLFGKFSRAGKLVGILNSWTNSTEFSFVKSFYNWIFRFTCILNWDT